MMRKIAALAASCAVLFGLSACSTPDTEAGAAPHGTRDATPSLSVPDLTYGRTTQLKLFTGDLERGTELTVYGFPMGWDTSKPVDCSDPEVKSTEYVVAGEGVETMVTMNVDMGYTSFVLAGPGMTTRCGETGSTTLRKIDPQLGVTLSGEAQKGAVKAGAETEITVLSADLHESKGARKITAEVRVNGPYQSVPEATAATCKNSKVALRTRVEIEPGSRSSNVNTKVKIPQAGVYFLTVATEESESVLATDTCGADDKKLITVG